MIEQIPAGTWLDSASQDGRGQKLESGTRRTSVRGDLWLFPEWEQIDNDGAVIQKYKPGTEMVYSTDERLYMVSAVRYVDEVVVYYDVDVDIQKLDFDILVVGPDQKHAGFQRAMQWCRDNGKEVVVLPRTEGISSTMLRQYSKTK